MDHTTHLLEHDAFADFCRRVGIHIGYSEHWPRDLSFRDHGIVERQWRLPISLGHRLYVLDALIRAIGQSGSLLWWPRLPCIGYDDPDGVPNCLWDTIANLIGLWPGFDGCVRSREQPHRDLGALASVHLLWLDAGGHVDFYLLPESGGLILMFDHHDTLSIQFRSEDLALKLERHLADAHLEATGGELRVDTYGAAG